MSKKKEKDSNNGPKAVNDAEGGKKPSQMFINRKGELSTHEEWVKRNKLEKLIEGATPDFVEIARWLYP